MSIDKIDYQKIEMPRWLIPLSVTLSLAGVSFLLWLIYVREPVSGQDVAFLGGVNAFLNACATVCLISGFIQIRRKNWRRHRGFMMMALLFSSLFLISYLIYHTFHGDTRFLGEGAIRAVYFFVLITHIILSALALPLILITTSLSLTKRFKLHRKWARWTLPIWLYVSSTGVAIFFLLKFFG